MEGMKGKWKKFETSQMRMQTTLATHNNKISSVETELHSLQSLCKKADTDNEVKITRITTYAHNLAHSHEERLKEQEVALSMTHRMMQEIKDKCKHLKTMGAACDTSNNELKNKENRRSELIEQQDRQVQNLQQEIVHLKKTIEELTKHQDGQINRLQQEIACLKENNKAHRGNIEIIQSSIQNNTERVKVLENTGRSEETGKRHVELEGHLERVRKGGRSSPKEGVNRLLNRDRTNRNKSVIAADETEEIDSVTSYLKQARQNHRQLENSTGLRNTTQTNTSARMKPSKVHEPRENQHSHIRVIHLGSTPVKPVHETGRANNQANSVTHQAMKEQERKKRQQTGGTQHTTSKRETSIGVSSSTEGMCTGEGERMSRSGQSSNPQETTTPENTQYMTYKEAVIQPQQKNLYRRKRESSQPSHTSAHPRKTPRLNTDGRPKSRKNSAHLTAPEPSQRATQNSQNTVEPLHQSHTKTTDNEGPTDFSDFVGVERERRKRKRFFIGYMRKADPKRLQDTIYRYADSKGVHL
ncbi:hypothetical protein Bbelb_380630 [Branchiostoma belcheri]|nr:hypothetical protein Bbelb_380630 [Branchiostoma belcheri]